MTIGDGGSVVEAEVDHRVEEAEGYKENERSSNGLSQNGYGWLHKDFR